ncbi:MAG TPA: hypothetical protein VF618_18405 [Thermoanaerobaculia bacterium]
MPETNWLALVISSIGGGVVVKFLDYAHGEYTRRRARREAAKDLLVKHHDPILKAADELVGRIRSLAISDFADFRESTGDFLEVRRAAAMFYFVQFWCQVQLMRLDSGATVVAADSAGGRLQTFIQELESRAIRVFDRAWQRAAGEAILVREGPAPPRPMNLFEFASRYESDDKFRHWLTPLHDLLVATGRDPTSRHSVLKYGAVVHALVDTLDPAHIITSAEDKGWPNKMPPNVRAKLAMGTFRRRLDFVTNSHKYTEPQKKERPAGVGSSITE